ncbi:MAG TPA: DUF222 domain-containing protein, partial [Kofleriaceae bacterium]|nr:DUF222 domain-containing protein [Kofleriaceae bacterium]
LRIATPANEAMILEHARLTTASQLEMLVRKYARVQRHGQDRRPRDDEQRRYVRRRDTDDGMVKIEAVLHPEEAEQVWAMLDHAAKQAVAERGSQSHAVDDSAESGAAAALAGAAIGMPGCAAETSRSDSAESSRSVAPALDVRRGDVGTGLAAAAGISARPERELRARAIGEAGSAEAVADARLAGGTNAEMPGRAAVTSCNDSAESSRSVAPEPAPADASALRRLDLVTELAAAAGIAACTEGALRARAVGEVGSAESDTDALAARAVHAATLGGAAGSLAADSAESSGSMTAARMTEAVDATPHRMAAAEHQPLRPLLDRLIDQIEELEIARAEQTARIDASRGEHGVWAEHAAHSEHPARRTPELVAASRSAQTDPAVAAEPGILRRRSDAMRWAFDRADALVSIAQAYLRGDRPQRAPIDVMITIPASSLHRDAIDAADVGCIGESCISAETARRLSCDAGVIEVIEDEHGVPLSAGRKRRTIAGSIKRALLHRDTTCSYPSCTNRMFLEGHHIEHWADGGATSLDNAALLCSHHHRYVHEYGYAIELGADGRPQFRDPNGRLIATVPARPASGDLAWPHIHAANASLSIDASTIACEWDGRPVPYGRIVSELVAVDGLT